MRARGPSTDPSERSFDVERYAIAVGALLVAGTLFRVWRAHSHEPQTAPAIHVNQGRVSAPLAKGPAESTAVTVQNAGAPKAPGVMLANGLAERASIGKRIFFDTRLSSPEGTSCASCHDPSEGYAGQHGSKLGVAQGSVKGRFARRNTPSVLYLRFVPRFHVRWDDEADFPEAFGGFFWDGRADTIAEVAPQPLLNENEMGNTDLQSIFRKLETSSYAGELRAEFDGVFDSAKNATRALADCLEAFLISPEMSPFTSKYDDYLRGETALSALETEGLALFDDRSKASCSSCHKFDDTSRLPEASLFSDFGYDTVGVPHNPRLPADPRGRAFDLGLCERKDPRRHTEDEWFCGSFRTPSLRNVARRRSFMHNGAFSNLRDVVSFYATRSTDPKRWYPKTPFDDLPAKYRKYVNTNVPPYNLPEGSEPALDGHQIDAIVAFLGTLTDREVPGPPP